MRAHFITAFTILAGAAIAFTPSRKTLDMYAIDVEGGKSTLIVAPSGESILIDTGNIGESARRDAERIMAAIQDAGLRQIDHLVTTHWHRDHAGGMALIAGRVPIREFMDHGANVQPDPPIDAFLKDTYPALYARAKHTVLKPGDRIPVAGLDLRVVTAAGRTIETPRFGNGIPNPHCAEPKPPVMANNENTQSVGILITYGRFRSLDLGDLPASMEFDLMCPNNLIGVVDLWMVSHHGQPAANSKALVHALEPRVAIMNNGAMKGGQPEVLEVIHTAPGLENLWQLHFSLLSGQQYTVPGLFIANDFDEPLHAMPTMPAKPIDPLPASNDTDTPAPAHNGPAYWIKVSAQPDGTFTVVNGRNGFAKTYRARTEWRP